MTIKEFIEKLKEFNPEALVFIGDNTENEEKTTEEKTDSKKGLFGHKKK